MLETPVYAVKRLGKVKNDANTKPLTGTLRAIFKFDGSESEHCVYNELVAVRLAQTLHIPVAAGVLTVAGRGHAFASLELGGPGLRLPDALPEQIPLVAERYPEAVAALVAFDILIGNSDRYSNFKARLLDPHILMFTAFDQGNALLGLQTTIQGCLGRLMSRALIARAHPFYGWVRRDALYRWVDRIIRTPSLQISDCCLIGWPVGQVSVASQEALGIALDYRRKWLRKIVTDNIDVIRPV